ncbi:hypothetical protein PDUR_01730 [Paenibacillus durus]|uniref:Uncharacterized protein n=1 Tax=Paenibacillus durus TaxID=44251 RepID=A0A089HJP5_PAEDU|nr:hypothetical protein PDUR_01730 [Paenibacillus durus]
MRVMQGYGSASRKIKKAAFRQFGMRLFKCMSSVLARYELQAGFDFFLPFQISYLDGKIKQIQVIINLQ